MALIAHDQSWTVLWLKCFAFIVIIVNFCQDNLSVKFMNNGYYKSYFLQGYCPTESSSV